MCLLVGLCVELLVDYARSDPNNMTVSGSAVGPSIVGLLPGAQTRMSPSGS